jgi:hypothetical protein
MVSHRVLLNSHIMFNPDSPWFYREELDTERTRLQLYELKLPCSSLKPPAFMPVAGNKVVVSAGNERKTSYYKECLLFEVKGTFLL